MNAYPPVPQEYEGWAQLLNILYLTCACTGTVAAISKAAAWWKKRTADLLALVVVRVVTVAAFLGGMPLIQDHLARATDIPNIGTLITYPCIVLQSLASQLILRFWEEDQPAAWRGARWLVALYSLLLPGMIVLFLNAPVQVNRPVDFDVYYATTPAIIVFQLVYNLCFVAGLLANIRMMRKYSALVDGMPWTRRGLRITLYGSVLGLGLAVTKVPSMIAIWFGYDFLNFANIVIGPLLSSAAALLHHLGATLPAWGSRLEERGRLLRCLLQMQPLWHALTQARPDIAYDSVPDSRLSTIVRAHSLKRILYRAVIEIRDGQRELRPYFDPNVAAVAYELAAEAGLDEHDRRNVMDAAVLAAAIQAKHQGTSVPGSSTVELSATAGELPEEIAALASLGRAFTDSAIVTAAVHNAAAGYKSSPTTSPSS
ncbi:MAB_1171c family putative transporter [Streptomyces sp. NPDC094034]|uniref:MAB_1171c family putative transporter n=1 Tax=Streptomyces sp. NPDC094034 TaxID=3155309 RepID=UPI00332BE98B